MSKKPLLEVQDISKLFGSVIALTGVSLTAYPGEVTCLLGDNGAGKSTLIKILSGVHPQTTGKFYYEGKETNFMNPREAIDAGIATVYQDLSLVPLMSTWRNFFLGVEPEKGFGPFKRYDAKFAKKTVREEMAKMGIDIRDADQPVGTMSGGERQSIAISRAIYLGAKVLILDEPTAALGVKQAGIVLNYIVKAKKRGLAVVLITHNPNHAYPVGDHFVILSRGKIIADARKEQMSENELINLMAGGEDLKLLRRELAELLEEDG